jgi:hypothetical protein
MVVRSPLAVEVEVEVELGLTELGIGESTRAAREWQAADLMVQELRLEGLRPAVQALPLAERCWVE